MVLVAAAAVAGALRPTPFAVAPAVALIAFALLRSTSWRWVVLAAGLALTTSSLASAQWQAFDRVPTGPWQGEAVLVTDPRPVANGFGGATRVELVLQVDGRRYVGWVGGQLVSVAAELRGGERVHLDAARTYPRWGSARRLASRHIVGEVRIRSLSRLDGGTRLASAVNWLRSAAERGSRDLPLTERGLLRALLYGDDRDLPSATVDTMRAAGLSHLSAVSGQQVALVLVVAGPLLRRLRPWSRWLATLLVIGWFAAITRFEPSVLRASWMAALGATSFALGGDRRPLRLLALSVIGMVAIDPLIVISPAWWLSVAATVGVAWLAPPLEAALVGPGWLRRPLAVTLGAQLAVAPVAAAVFGWPPLMSIPANVLVVPAVGAITIAGFVMVASAAALPFLPWSALWWPLRWVLRWVLTVAELAERLEPSWAPTGWTLLLLALGARCAQLAMRYWRARYGILATRGRASAHR